MDDWSSNFCHNVCCIRKLHRMSQKDMAEVLGISVTKLRRMERCDPSVRLGMRLVVRFCSYFQLSGDAVLLERLREDVSV